MQFVRTPDERFANLAGYPFAPHYVDIADGSGGSLRMHYIDEGRRRGEIVLCLHGQPTWSYLYRKMIPPLVSAGHRVVAPDLIGFGKSDKPTARGDYTYARHVAWLRSFVTKLDLTDITLVCQDWGGLIGLRVLTELPERFARVVVANTGLPDAHEVPSERAAALHELFERVPVVDLMTLALHLSGARSDPNGAPPFMYWQKFCAETPELTVSHVVAMAAGGMLAPELARAYDAPFPDESFKAGARQFPSLVPIIPDDPAIPANRRAWELLRTFDKPLLTAFSDGDPITRGGEQRFQAEVPGAQNQPHVMIHGAGHFLQEDKGEELADVVVRFMAANPNRHA
jgi:haloalkane dehalogenase